MPATQYYERLNLASQRPQCILDLSLNYGRSLSVVGMEDERGDRAWRPSAPAWTKSCHFGTRGNIFDRTQPMVPRRCTPKATTHPRPPLRSPLHHLPRNCLQQSRAHYSTLLLRPSRYWPQCFQGRVSSLQNSQQKSHTLPEASPCVSSSLGMKSQWSKASGRRCLLVPLA